MLVISYTRCDIFRVAGRAIATSGRMTPRTSTNSSDPAPLRRARAGETTDWGVDRLIPIIVPRDVQPYQNHFPATVSSRERRQQASLLNAQFVDHFSDARLEANHRRRERFGVLAGDGAAEGDDPLIAHLELHAPKRPGRQRFP